MLKHTVTYTDLDGSCPRTTFHGVPFEDGEPVEIEGGADLVAAARSNPWFEVEDGSSAGGGEVMPPVQPLKAEHRGRGSYSIMRGDVEVREGLTKAQAEEFGALSDEGKEAFIAQDEA